MKKRTFKHLQPDSRFCLVSYSWKMKSICFLPRLAVSLRLLVWFENVLKSEAFIRSIQFYTFDRNMLLPLLNLFLAARIFQFIRNGSTWLNFNFRPLALEAYLPFACCIRLKKKCWHFLMLTMTRKYIISTWKLGVMCSNNEMTYLDI